MVGRQGEFPEGRRGTGAPLAKRPGPPRVRLRTRSRSAVTAGEKRRGVRALYRRQPARPRRPYGPGGGFDDHRQPVVGSVGSWEEACGSPAWSGARMPTEASGEERRDAAVSPGRLPWQEDAAGARRFPSRESGTPRALVPNPARALRFLSGRLHEWCVDWYAGRLTTGGALAQDANRRAADGQRTARAAGGGMDGHSPISGMAPAGHRSSAATGDGATPTTAVRLRRARI